MWQGPGERIPVIARNRWVPGRALCRESPVTVTTSSVEHEREIEEMTSSDLLSPFPAQPYTLSQPGSAERLHCHDVTPSVLSSKGAIPPSALQ